MATGRRWQSDVELILELGTGATRPGGVPSLWDTGLWDSALWSGQEPLWLPVECVRIVSVGIRGGRDTPWDSFDAGTCGIVFADEDNRYAWSPDIDPPDTALRPGSPVRVQALYQGVRYPLFRGYVEILSESIDGESVIQVSLSCQDAISQIARSDALEQSPVGAGDTTTQRVNRLLDVAQWPTDWRILDATTVTHQATTLAQPTWDEMLTVVWTEGGAVYGDRNGNIRLRARTWYLDDPKSTTVQKVVGNVSGVCPASIEWARAADDVVNDVSLARVGGSAVTRQDLGSWSRYGRRSWHRFDLSADNDAAVAARADLLLEERKAPRPQIDAIVIDGEAAQDWPFMLSVDYGWKLDVWYRHPVYGWEIHFPVFVQSVETQVRPDGWQLRLGVNDVDPIDQALSYWDIARWDNANALWQ